MAPSILDVFRLAADLIDAAARSDDPSRDGHALVEAIHDSDDGPTAIAAIHALGRLTGVVSDDRLAELVGPGDDWRIPHAAWALAERPPHGAAIEPLVGLVVAGRLAGMLAQRTLAGWAGARPGPVVAAINDRLRDEPSATARGRLVETLGLLDDTEPQLATLAGDGSEALEARIAAVAALGDHPGEATWPLEAAAAGDGPLADAARLALLDCRPPRVPEATPDGEPLRLAQVHMGSRLDAALSHAGEGQTGGIATLLVQLGDALVRDRRVEAVTTIGRGPADDALASLGSAGGRHAVVTVPLARHEGSSFTDPWPALVAAERGLRRSLRLRPADLLHVRMADVGSLAAARAARRLGLPTVFTLAPDPHAVIAEMEQAGELDRRSFGPGDGRGGLWFRAWLVGRLAGSSKQVVLLPRPDLRERLLGLLGIDVAEDPTRYHVVPEGIDTGPIRAARGAAIRALEEAPSGIVTELRDRIAALGPARQGLPIVVSVGRLVEVKGMARIAEAFAADPGLRRRANLVIIGGDLTDPSPEERAEIDRLEAILVPYPELAEALVLLGHQPHDDALRVLAVAGVGLPPWIAPGGAYVAGSRKEEFGLAIVEALATGLPVVAPSIGGPASYVEDGRTGRLVDTLDQRALGQGIRDALDLVGRPGRARAAEQLVEERYTIRTMADALIPVYDAARAPRMPATP